jgi:hypothetical protein
LGGFDKAKTGTIRKNKAEGIGLNAKSLNIKEKYNG